MPTPRAGPGRRGMGGPVLRTGLLTGREGEPVINVIMIAGGDPVAKTRLAPPSGPFGLTLWRIEFVIQSLHGELPGAGLPGWERSAL